MGNAPGTYQAIIKDNADKLGMGRVRVYVPAFGGDPTDERKWYTVSYMSSQAGQTNPYQNTKGGKKEMESQDSYGSWATGYDKENEVVVNFMSDNPNSGMIMGGMFQQNMTHSIAGFARADTHQGKNMPAFEYNKRDDEINPRAPIRPRNERLYKQLSQQGLLQDAERGNVSTSPHRDSVSQFMSKKTPRGSSFIMDDGKMDPNAGAGVNTRQYARQPGGGGSMIRMRTEGGAQLIMNDDCGYLHMTSSTGNSWAQLTDNGVQFFTEGSVALRVQGNYNMRVDGNYASETLGTTSYKIGGTMNITTDGGVNVRDAGDGIKLEATGAYGMNSEANSIQESDANISQMSGGNIIKKASYIMKDTETGYVAPEVPALQIGKATDNSQRLHSDNTVETQQSAQVDTTLPNGGLTGHEPWAGQGQACGKPTDPAEAQEAQPTEDPQPADFNQGDTPPGKEVVRVVDAGPGWTEVELADGTIERRTGDRAWRNNNPGNITAGDYANRHGAVGSDALGAGHTMAVFPTRQAGIDAQANLLFNGDNYKNQTVAGAISRYAPPSSNNTQAYINRVVAATPGITSNTIMSSMTASQRAAFTQAMFSHEGGKVGTTIRR